MTQEEKDLLIKDLCARLPYGVKINYSTGPANHCIFTLTELNVKTSYDEQYDLHCYPKLNGIYNYFDCLPYLRSMSSMTKEERYEIQRILGKDKDIEIFDDFIHIIDSSRKSFSFLELQALLDWLNKKMFDYSGLISKGLALEAPEGMYKEE